MDYAVVFKWARDPQTARVSADGAVDWGRSQPVVGDDEPAAIEIAKILAQPTGARLVGVTIAGGDLAWAAARGAQETIIVTDATPDQDTSATAAMLAAVVRSTPSIGLVTIGDSAWNRALPVALAAALGWPCIAQVESAEPCGEDRIRVGRKSGTGVDVIETALPVVLACVAHAEEKKTPGMKEILAARRAPQVKVTIAELNAAAPDRVVSRGTRVPDSARVQLFEGDNAASELVAALRADGVC
ncbi:putative electron transfer flavoprotein FixA [Propionibacterium australiense]|uniref:Electron transfer flavoprotein, alpha/beta-subunit, N-terminal n=1 Tax=Propionibacterium australiense TaxID=119981 RepID=A0A383S589_9ACTN|nr:Electron transfer flavoprotein, alpha/beta-subunit, N-terminal [Propionibacterium australiense]VEH91675.1 putative electron transfer flavoprotein FixA [Propionibacterium australiense]